MSVFRVEKNKDFTVMSNCHLRDKRLSLRSKGLMSVMLSLPEEWDYTLRGLAIISREGIDAIRVSIKELEAAGYIERSRRRNEKGQLTDAEYVIHEKPEPREPALDEPVLEKPMLEKPTLENPMLVKPTQAKPTLENPTQLIKDKSNKNKSNTERINYPSINPASVDRSVDEYEQNAEFVRKNICYESLTATHDRAVVDEIVNIMAEVLTVERPSYVIEGCTYSAELVRKRLRDIDYAGIESFLLQFEKNTQKIRNMKAYLITSLFNIPATAEAQLQNAVAFDLYGGSDT